MKKEFSLDGYMDELCEVLYDMLNEKKQSPIVKDEFESIVSIEICGLDKKSIEVYLDEVENAPYTLKGIIIKAKKVIKGRNEEVVKRAFVISNTLSDRGIDKISYEDGVLYVYFKDPKEIKTNIFKIEN